VSETKSNLRRNSDPKRLSGFTLLKNLGDIKKNFVLAYYELFQNYGNVLYFSWPIKSYLFFHPNDVKHILKDNFKNYKKSETYKELYPLIGKGLVTSEGNFWRRNRRVVAPEFTLKKVGSYQGKIVSVTANMLDEWENNIGKEVIKDISNDVMQLVFQIASEVLMGSDSKKLAPDVAQSLNYFMERFIKRVYSIIKLPDIILTPGALRSKKSISKLDKIMQKIIDLNRNSSSKDVNVLTRLMNAHYDDTNSRMNDKQLRDEIMTLMMAGHETTGNAILWTCYLLGKHPNIQDALYEEIDSVLGRRNPDNTDLENLQYNKMIILEAMRLYPPVPGVSRQSIAEDKIGNINIAPNTKVEVSMYVTHRHPEFWDDPEKFEPDRFSAKNLESQIPFTYFPFGGGDRACIGGDMAMLELQLIMAMIIQRFKIEISQNFKTYPHPTISLKPSNGVKVKLTAR